MNNYLKQTFFFFRNNFSALLSIQLPFIAILTFIQFTATQNMANIPDKQIFLLLATEVLLVPTYLGATLFYLQSVIDEQPLSTVQSWICGMQSWVRLFTTFIFASLMIALGLVLFILPGIYIGVRLALANPICVLEGKGAIQAVKTSWHASNGTFWTLFKGLALIYGALIGLELIIIPQLPPQSLSAIGLSAALEFASVLGIIYAFRVYRAWRDQEPIEESPLL